MGRCLAFRPHKVDNDDPRVAWDHNRRTGGRGSSSVLDCSRSSNSAGWWCEEVAWGRLQPRTVIKATFLIDLCCQQEVLQFYVILNNAEGVHLSAVMHKVLRKASNAVSENSGPLIEGQEYIHLREPRAEDGRGDGWELYPFHKKREQSLIHTFTRQSKEGSTHIHT